MKMSFARLSSIFVSFQFFLVSQKSLLFCVNLVVLISDGIILNASLKRCLKWVRLTTKSKVEGRVNAAKEGVNLEKENKYITGNPSKYILVIPMLIG